MTTATTALQVRQKSLTESHSAPRYSPQFLGSVTKALKPPSDNLAVTHVKLQVSLPAKAHTVITLSARTTETVHNLVQEVDLRHGVGGFPGVLHQQCNEPHKGIQIVVALGSDHGGVGSRVVLLLSLSTIADFNTHFSAKPEKAGDQVVCFQDALLVHLPGKGRTSEL